MLDFTFYINSQGTGFQNPSLSPHLQTKGSDFSCAKHILYLNKIQQLEYFGETCEEEQEQTF